MSIILNHIHLLDVVLETTHLEPPIEQWADDGLLTIVDDEVIDISYIVNWFLKQQQKYNLTKVISDNFRTDIVRQPFEDAYTIRGYQKSDCYSWVISTTYRYYVC